MEVCNVSSHFSTTEPWINTVLDDKICPLSWRGLVPRRLIQNTAGKISSQSCLDNLGTFLEWTFSKLVRAILYSHLC